jgi:hypothetical protein
MIKDILDESAATDATLLALEPHRTRNWNSSQYLWDVISHDVIWIESAASSYLSNDYDYILTFDPHPQNASGRLGFSRLIRHEKMDFGYKCSAEDIRLLLKQPFAANSDFYIMKSSGELVGFRTHEDSVSDSGFWMVANAAEQDAAANP